MNTRRPTVALGDDGTPAADVAWLWINNHAWPGWRLEVITAHQPPVGRVLPREQIEPHPWQPPHPRQPFAAAQFDEVANLTADADPRLALTRSVDLLVIGPRGPGLLKSLHLGSTADWLLLRPPAPLAIIRHGRAVRSAVLCTDGSTHAARATEALCGLPWVSQLHVTVMAVVDGRADADVAAAAAAQQLQAVGATVAVEVRAGKPTNLILGHLEQTSPDLVVLGTKGLTGLPRLRLGSTAATVARAADCSVLVACAETADNEPDN
jgi:nucleotide-binding universal stress UspA family protein